MASLIASFLEKNPDNAFIYSNFIPEANERIQSLQGRVSNDRAKYLIEAFQHAIDRFDTKIVLFYKVPKREKRGRKAFLSWSIQGGKQTTKIVIDCRLVRTWSALEISGYHELVHLIQVAYTAAEGVSPTGNLRPLKKLSSLDLDPESIKDSELERVAGHYEREEWLTEYQAITLSNDRSLHGLIREELQLCPTAK